MTYCVGFLLESGLVFASDSRTNAGVDYISSYSKMHVFQPAPDRLFVLMAAGNLGTTQAVLNRIRRDLAVDEAAAAAANQTLSDLLR
jgi:putative proteasome-type protease